jgi:hypothetical protein
MNILKHLIRPPLARAAAVPPTAATDKELSGGCGWFDSSHELKRGLAVTEYIEAHAAAQVLPPGAWLVWQLQDSGPASGPRRYER